MLNAFLEGLGLLKNLFLKKTRTPNNKEKQLRTSKPKGKGFKT